MKKMVVAVIGVVAWMSGTPAAYAATAFDQTISVPGSVGGAFICVEDPAAPEDEQCVDVPGVNSLTIRIQADAVAAENTKLEELGAGCERVDKRLRLDLASNALGAVTISFVTVDPHTKEATQHGREISFGSGQTETPSRVIKLCVR